MSPDVDQKIDAFVAKHTCNKTVVITAALIEFLRSNEIEPLYDPRPQIRNLMKPKLPPEVGSGSW